MSLDIADVRRNALVLWGIVALFGIILSLSNGLNQKQAEYWELNDQYQALQKKNFEQEEAIGKFIISISNAMEYTRSKREAEEEE